MYVEGACGGTDGCAILEHRKDEVRDVFSFNHFNFNVSDLDKSLAFYKTC